jgi:hypothetical protein
MITEKPLSKGSAVMAVKITSTGNNGSSTPADLKLFGSVGNVLDKTTVAPGTEGSTSGQDTVSVRSKFGDTNTTGPITMNVHNDGNNPISDGEGNTIDPGTDHLYSSDTGKIDETFHKV